MPDITEFRGTNRFLSNFALVDIEVQGYPFPSTENAYQAYKSQDKSHVSACMHCTPGVSKALGKTCNVRDDFDFDDIKVDFMTAINKLKFMQSPFYEKLMATGDVQIIEGNTWHDNFWGDCSCDSCKDIVGQNHLGKILMSIRAHHRLDEIIEDEAWSVDEKVYKSSCMSCGKPIQKIGGIWQHTTCSPRHMATPQSFGRSKR